MEKIITPFSGLLWSIFNPLRRGSLQDGGGGVVWLSQQHKAEAILSAGGLRTAWLAATDGACHDKTPASMYRFPLTLHCFCHQAWHSADPVIRTRTLLLFFSPRAQERKKKKQKRHLNRGGGVDGAKPLVSVFIGSWINMAFLIQKGSAVMESEYLSLPPGAGVLWQGRRW